MKVVFFIIMILFSASIMCMYADYRRESKEIEEYYERLRIDLWKADIESHKIQYQTLIEDKNAPKIVIRKQHCPIKSYTERKLVAKRVHKTVTRHTQEEWRVWFRRLDNEEEFMLNVNSQQFNALELNEKIDTIK